MKNMNVEEKASTVAPSKLTSSAMAPKEGHKGGVVQEGDAQQRLKETKVYLNLIRLKCQKVGYIVCHCRQGVCQVGEFYRCLP